MALITKELRKRTRKPLIVKLTPNVTHISEFARAAEAEGADAVSVINTLIGMAVNIRTKKPKLSTVTGGLSGPAIKPVALAKVFEVYKSVKIPVFGIGGIATWEDAVEFFLVGASAVQVGTQNFVNPASAVEIAKGVAEYCARPFNRRHLAIGGKSECRRKCLCYSKLALISAILSIIFCDPNPFDTRISLRPADFRNEARTA